MAEIAVRGVVKRFAGTAVVRGVDLQIADGELAVVVGPSGCGKSTLLRMIAGLESVSEGDILIDGRRVNHLEPKDRDIAMVFQNYALYPHMDVYQNMAYGLRLRGTRKDAVRRRVQEAAQILGLEELLQRKPRQLSGGQRQRVAMGRAIVREPRAFLFDEPLSNLDAKLRVQMRLEIKQLLRRLRTTSLYVTHDQVEALTLADLLIVMHGGIAEQIGAPMALYERPATRFVASFIGSPAMNFLAGDLGADGAAVHIVGAELPLRLEGLVAAHGGRPVTVGLRPEHLQPARGRAADFTFRVEVVEPLGSDTLLHGRLANANGQCLSARVPGNLRPKSGDCMPLCVAPQDIHLFDPESGRRLSEPAAPSDAGRLPALAL